jgi:ribosomal-protein-alanine N-acetyltransferase
MGAPCLIRPATSADGAALAALEQVAFSDPWSEASFRELLHSSVAFGLVAEVDGSVAGYLIARVVAGEGEVLNLAVAPERRRRGFAGALLGAALERMRSRGAVEAFLEVRASNAAAIELYRGAGFELAGRREGYYRAPVEAALLLRRGLGPGSH